MKNMHYSAIKVNGVYYDGKNLADLCRLKLSDDNTPEWELKLYRFIEEWIATKSFLKIRTSGSTGKPKQIRIQKDKMVQSAMMTGDFFDLKPNDKALLCLPMDYIAGKMMVVRAFVLGLNLVTVKPSGKPAETLDESFDFAAMTPFQVANTIFTPDGRDKLNNIDKLIIGGAGIHPELMTEIKTLSNQIWQTYGLTETITHIALRKLNPPGESENYTALPGVSFQIDDRRCLVIDVPALSGQKIATNDIVDLLNNSEFRFIGRYDNVINSGGIKIFPEPIEDKLSSFINNRFIIAGLPDKKLGQRPVIIIEGKEVQDIQINELSKNAGLSKLETPVKALFVLKFPLTMSGKIKRKELISLALSNS